MLTGAVDMRTYQHKHLVLFSRIQGGLRWRIGPEPDTDGLVAGLTTCVEWLDEHFGFELVTIFTNPIEPLCVYYAMLRRRSSS